MTAPAELEVGRAIGARVDRKEDRKLLLGQAQWVDNMRAPDMVYLAVVRSPYAHARITKVDVAPALAHADVVAAWSGADLAEDWLGRPPLRLDPHRRTRTTRTTRRSPSTSPGTPGTASPSSPRGRRAGAEDAAELVEVDYEPLDAVADAQAALADGAPLVHEEFGTNRCYTWKLDAGDVDAAVRRGRRHGHRALPPEPPDPERDRAAGGLRPAASGERRVHDVVDDAGAAHRSGHAERRPGHPRVEAARDRAGRRRRLRLEAQRVRRKRRWRSPSRAGWSGRSSGPRPAPRATCRRSTVATSSRRSSSPRQPKGRSRRSGCGLTVNMGAYLQLVTAGTPLLGAWLYGGCYDIQGYSFECTGVFTHTTPTDAYRGRRQARGDVRDRARRRRPRPEAGQGPGRAAAAELHPRVSRTRSPPG